MKIKIAVIAIVGLGIGTKAQEKIMTENGAKPYFIYKEGKIGIGTINPNAKLDVRGNISITGSEEKNDSYISQLKFINLYTTTSPMASIGVKTRKSVIAPFDYSNIVFNTSNGYNTLSEKMRIADNGNVGIGTTNPDAKLAVNGTIHSKEVKVDLTGWPDYVFSKEYKLPTLQEVEQHINKNGHLQNIPSTKEVKDNGGIELGEMNRKLLEKIEELTLYTIQQQKELEAAKEKNNTLERRLNEIEKLIKSKIVE